MAQSVGAFPARRALFRGVDHLRLSGSPYWFPLTCALVLLTIIVLLTLLIVYMTFVPGLPLEGGLTLQNWARVATPYVLTRVLPDTAIVGLATVAVSVFFAAPLAWILNRANIPLRNLFITAIAAEVMIPGFVQAMGWLILVNARIGLINALIANAFGVQSVPIDLQNPVGIGWVMGLSLTPTMFFLLSGPMRMLDPTLEEAAAMSGAGRLATLLRVSFPLMLPALLGGAIYSFMSAISFFDIPALLGAAGGQVPVLAAELFYAVHPANQSVNVSYGAAGVYGVLIAAPSLVALLFYFRVLGQARRYSVITGKGYRPRDVELGRWTWVAIGFVLLYLVCGLVLPLLVLIWASLLPTIQFPSPEALGKISLDNYAPSQLLPALGGSNVLLNTLLLIVSVPLILLFFSFMISWIVVRTDLPARRVMDTLAMLPHAIPGLAFAFALFMVAIMVARWSPALAFANTLVIIIVANVLSHLAYVTRVTNAALLQVNAELEECARVHGGRTTDTMWRVLLPLIRPSLVYAGLWTAMLTFREVSMALFLSGPKNGVLSVGVWLLWQQGKFDVGAASAIVLVALTGIILFAALALSGNRGIERRQLSAVDQHD